MKDTLDWTRLAKAYHQGPTTLLGDQQTRVALLRALLVQPKVLLPDEPSSRFDAAPRGDFRQWIFSEVRELAVPITQVMHDLQDVPANSSILDMAQ